MRSFFVLLCLLLGATQALATRSIEGDEVWSGKVAVEENLVVPAGASLTIRPGTEIRFASETTLAIEGRFSAQGTAEKPIAFLPASGSEPNSWQGISFQNARDESELKFVRMVGAAVSLTIVGSRVRLSSSSLLAGTKGIALAVGADALIEGVTIKGMSEGGIDASVRSRVKISACTIEDVLVFGIQTAKQAVSSVRDNRISGAKFGILFNGDFPPLEGNTIDNCETGIALIQASPDSIVRGNRVSNSKTGIGCHQFCSPIIEQNILVNCDKGIDCFQGSSPTVQHNRFTKNRNGIFCVQMCNPVVTLNDFIDNQIAAYLHLSSYAQFHHNNFAGNKTHIELDNMSYDWELRATKKPKRNRQMQNEALAQQGRVERKDIPVEVESEGFVDAVGNYWGPETTLEMEAKGDVANIAGLNDGFDVPILTYEGWPGEYQKDRIRYAGWLKQRVAQTGP